MQPTSSPAPRTTGAEPETKWQKLLCLLLVLAVFVVFGQTAGFEFVGYDDSKYVFENPVVRAGLTWHGLVWAFNYGEIGHWHPLTWLSHMADCQVYHLLASGHHTTNVLLHAAATALLFLVLRRMTGEMWRSAFVAAVFAIHPLRAESVAWVSERKDVLSGLFFMLTLWAYLRHVRAPSPGRMGLVTLFYALGLLSKNMLVSLPLVLLTLDWWPLRRLGPARSGQEPSRQEKVEVEAQAVAGARELIREKVPLFLLAAGSCAMTLLTPEYANRAMIIPFSQRLGNALVSCAIYLRQMVYPAGLALPYPFPKGGWPTGEVVLSGLLLAALTIAAIRLRRRCPYLLAGWVWFLVMLLPVIGLVQVSYYSHADRYTYLPGIGLALAGTWAVADWAGRWASRRVLVFTGCAMVGVLMVWCFWQTRFWRDTETLSRRALGSPSPTASPWTTWPSPSSERAK